MGRIRANTPRLLAVGLFLAVALSFHLCEPYTHLFFSSDRGALLLYSLLRSAFCAYFLVILFSIGNAFLSLWGSPGPTFGLSPVEEVAISVLCGSAILRVSMLGLGFLGLYPWWLLVSLSGALVWVGTPRLAALVAVNSASTSLGWRSSSEKVPTLMAAAGLAVGCLVVWAYKFMLPNGTGDYFSHYLPYYQAVTERGDIWPNEVWYHFYISKGAGDVFYAIILSDLLGPLTVSFCMFITALMIMYCLLWTGTKDRLIALAGAALTAAAFVWTVETTIGFRYWAEFSKEHVTTSVLFIGAIWALWRQRSVPVSAANSWACVVAALFVGLVLLRVQFAVLLLATLCLIGLREYLDHKRIDARTRAVPAVATFAAALASLATNYAITGLIEVTPFRLFWQYADQEKFARWVSPFLMLLLDQGSSENLGSISPPDLKQFPLGALVIAIFRLDRLSPYACLYGVPAGIAAVLAVKAIWEKRGAFRSVRESHLEPCIAIAVTAAAVFFTVNQIGSLFRIYMFMMFPVIALGLVPFVLARSLSRPHLFRWTIGLLLSVIVLLAPFREAAKIPSEERILAARFLLGRASIGDAFSAQNAVWPAALKMAEVAGPKVPIWISQVGLHFCVAPPCNMQSFFSFSMGKDWATIVFGTPAQAKTALQQQGINYFAIDTGSPFFDLLPYSPLFGRGSIRENFGVAWTDGTVYLLTWASARTEPPSEEFFIAYSKSVAAATRLADFEQLHARLARAYSEWQQDKKWPIILSRDLPRIRGWQ